jgi:hypothetical protein
MQILLVSVSAVLCGPAARLRHVCSARSLLPFGMDAVRVVYLAAGQVLQPRVAVEAAAVLLDLGQPWLYRLDRRIHCDGPRGHGNGVGDEFIAGQWLAPLFIGSPPAPHPRSDHGRVGDRQGRAQGHEWAESSDSRRAGSSQDPADRRDHAAHQEQVEERRGSGNHPECLYGVEHRDVLGFRVAALRRWDPFTVGCDGETLLLCMPCSSGRTSARPLMPDVLAMHPSFSPIFPPSSHRMDHYL